MCKILYFDCLSGISGDMTIASLIDLGVDEDYFINEIEKLQFDQFNIKIHKAQKNGITGTRFLVESLKNHNNEKGHIHRGINDIESIINNSNLNENIKKISIEIFNNVAKAEAKIHNKPLNEVHFHEVGAVDSIVDIVGSSICIDYLKPDMILSSPIHVGTGFVKCAHGIIPVPAPATLEILKGIPIYSKGIRSELVTPTGAAIIKSLAEDFISLPEITIDKIGYGHGTKDLEITNSLRTIIGKKKVKKI